MILVLDLDTKNLIIDTVYLIIVSNVKFQTELKNKDFQAYLFVLKILLNLL